MNADNLKILYLLAASAFVCLAVYLLFPYGNDLLLAVRENDEFNEIVSGPEVIYSYIDTGSIEVADQILQDQYEISRFSPVYIEEITWDENPYDDIYWRFNFYNLEPVRHLLYAWGRTHDPVYRDKLIEITESFLDSGMEGQYSWDLHGAAFRTMTLVDVWVKLKASESTHGDLPEDFSAKMLAALDTHGNFLADPVNYEDSYNHGLDQAAALYVLAYNFPELPSADQWSKTASDRIENLLGKLVDADGVLIENSPYYHFYVLQKFWEINKYLNQHDLFISDDFDDRLDQMISYGAHVLQPDLYTPTIGASLREPVRLADNYKEMAAINPEFLYVLSKGEKGKKPKKLNVHYPESGQTIMRSEWGEGDTFDQATQLIFDVGEYRTNHSDFDALSFHLYSNGLVLLPDAGLYSYDPGPNRTYFHGTRAHNTVVVDGMDQSIGGRNNSTKERVYSGTFSEGEGYAYQSGAHELYEGVIHQRAMVLIEDNTVVIFDYLESETAHTYEQMFHLFPGANLEINDFTVTARGESPEHTVTIKQYLTDGLELTPSIDEQDPLDGVCSFQYAQAVPCYALSYQQVGNAASYVTVINIGENPAEVSFDTDSNEMQVETDKRVYDINLGIAAGHERTVDVENKEDTVLSYGQPAHALNDYHSWYVDPESAETTGSASVGPSGSSIFQTLPVNGEEFIINRDTNLNLASSNLYFSVLVNQPANLDDFTIALSNDNWSKEAIYYLPDGVYHVPNIHRAGEWFQFSLPKTLERNPKFGAWEFKGGTFDWSAIDKVRFISEAKPGTNVSLSIKNFRLVPEQTEPRIVIIFDDGWKSVLDAATLMVQYGMKGVVGAISGSVEHKSYMSLEDLHKLQDTYGWNITNHSHTHKNATLEYVYKDNMEAYEEDIVNALQYLEQNNLNSAPNWFIYPHGNTHRLAKEVISKYYKFARSTLDGPESYPFAEPYDVKLISVYDGLTTNQDVYDAIDDAARYNHTLMLMFHKFSIGDPEVFTEWSLADFEEILKYIQDSGIKVVTLSELDELNGVPQTEFNVWPYEPDQFQLEVETTSKQSWKSVWQGLKEWLR